MHIKGLLNNLNLLILFINLLQLRDKIKIENKNQLKFKKYLQNLIIIHWLLKSNN